jgi:general secretion pathway protein L
MNAPPWIHNLFRADFLRSVGLYVMRDRLVLVRMRKNFLNLSLVEQEDRALPLGESQQAISELTGWIAEDVREIALKAESESRERAFKQAVLSLLPHFKAGRDSLFVCVPQEQAIVQQLFLPLAAEANLSQVIEYEIERQLPFRREDIFYDYVPMGKRGDKIGVYLLAIPKKSLASVLGVLESFGIRPRGVETTVTAMANFLLFCKGDFSGSAAVIGGHDHDWELIGVQSQPNGWRPTPQLLFSHWVPQSGWAQGPVKELLRECLERSPELYGWGDVDELFRSADLETPPYVDLVALGSERIAGGRAISQSYFLPALGAALRGVREAPLVGGVLREQGAADPGWKTFSRLNVILLGLVLLAVIGWGASFTVKDELRLRQLERENQKLEPAVAALRREESELARLRKELTVLTDLDRRKGEILRVLDELTKLVPTNAYLSNFRFRDQVLEVQGNAENASALIPVLERSPLFENVGFTAPSNRGRDNRETFSLKANLEKAKVEKAIKPDEKAMKPIERAVNPDEKMMRPDEKALKQEEKAIKPNEKAVKAEEKTVKPDEKADEKVIKSREKAAKP